MTALRTGEHIAILDTSRNGQDAPAGRVFAGCSSCPWRKNGALLRDEARQLHRDHLEQIVTERFERWGEAQDA